MILQRLATSIRKQDWFTVVIETLIVVLGVFLGLQLGNWNAERERCAEEAVYLARLHDEVLNLIETRRGLVDRRAETLSDMNDAVALLFSPETRSLRAEECESLAYNHYISNPTDDLGSLLELQSSGRISIIQNTEVSEALRAYLLTRARARDSQSQIAKLINPLLRLHPDLIRVASPTQVDSSDVESGIFTCDLDAMRSSHDFLNELEIAQSHLGHHVYDNARVDASLRALHTVLDNVLGIDHDEDAAQ